MAFKGSRCSGKVIHIYKSEVHIDLYCFQCLLSLDLFCRTTWCNRRSCYTLEVTLLRVCYSLLIKTIYTKSGGAFVNSVNSKTASSQELFVLLVVQKLAWPALKTDVSDTYLYKVAICNCETPPNQWNK